MDYQIMMQQEKKVAGTAVRTNNHAKEMPKQIGETWYTFQTALYQKIPEKKNQNTIGLYTEYESNENGDYTFLAGCEINSFTNLPAGIKTYTIPAGSYAVFQVQGDDRAIAVFWQKLWQMPLKRSFTFDFEEYYPDSTPENRHVSIYIALQDESPSSHL